MRRVVYFITAVTVLGSAGAWFLAQRDDTQALETAVLSARGAVEGSLRGFLGLGGAKPGIVAIVNGEPVALKEVEALYDMSMPTLTRGANSLEEVRADYSEQLQRLIVQRLIRQELASRRLSVSNEDVRKLEAVLGENAGPETFEQYMEEEGVNPAMWREQLRARLEMERWQAELARSVVVAAAEVDAYLAAHPEERQQPEEVEYLVVTAVSRTAAEATRKSGLTSLAELRGMGVDARRIRSAAGDVPDAWKKSVAELTPGNASALRAVDDAWRYVVLLERSVPRERTPVEVYARVEGLLAEKRLPEAFDQWLEKAVAKADIRMAHSLRPSNALRPEPRSRFSSSVPLRNDASPATPLPAMGEVSGEGEL